MNENRTLLLVDDNVDNLFLLRAAFEMSGNKPPLQEVHNGEEAIAYLKGEGAYSDRNKYPLPIVLLLDLNMPRKNGFEVLAWIRAQPVLRRLSIVVLTASNRGEDVKRAFDLGATSFLVKPISLDELTAMMRCLCEWIGFNHFPPLDEEGKNDKAETLDKFEERK